MEVQIQDHPNLVRDTHSKAILNTDSNKLKSYEAQRRQMEAAKDTVKQISEMKEELAMIKQILMELVNKQ